MAGGRKALRHYFYESNRETNVNEILGSEVKDRVTGFAGIVTGYVTYLTGCNQCLVAPPVDKDGKMQESHWIDESRLTVVQHDVVAPELVDSAMAASAPGFDREPPKR